MSDARAKLPDRRQPDTGSGIAESPLRAAGPPAEDCENPAESIYRLLCDNMSEGYCMVEVLFDVEGAPRDYVIRDVNAAFERQTGHVGSPGRRISEILPGQEPPWLLALAGVATSGNTTKFEQRSERLGRWYEVQAFRCGRPQDRLVGVLFTDITQRKLDDLMGQSILEYAIILLDPDGRVRTWNAGAERIKGYQRGEIIGKDFSIFYPPEDVAHGRPAEVLARAAQRGRFDEEGWRVRRDGSRFWASVSLTPLLDSDGKLQGYCKVTRDLSERKHAEEALQAEARAKERVQEQLRQLNTRLEAEVDARTEDLQRANADLLQAKDRLRQLSARLIDSQEKEREHVARHMYDDLGQILAVVRIRLAEMSPGSNDAAAQQCSQLLDEAIERARRLALQLRPTSLDDLGLDDALQSQLEQQASAAGWAATYNGSVGEQRFAGEVETACFRIAQEALTNAARHADATEVSVSLKVEGNRLVLVVADNGRGFDVERCRSPEERARHVGLLSMEERAGLVGAQFSIESAPARGTRVKAAFPLDGT